MNRFSYVLVLVLLTTLGCTDLVPGRKQQKAQNRQVRYLAQDVDALRNKNRKLEDQLDRMRARINHLEKSSGQTSPPDRIGSGGSHSVNSGTAGIPDSPVLAEDFTLGEYGGAELAYRTALARYEKGDTQGARQEFSRFLDQYPQSDLADNAQYWIGECHYLEKKYSEAGKAFNAVGRHFPFGNKVPDALLKAGMSFLNIGKHKQARESFSTLKELFPGSSQDQKAEAFRQKLIAN